MRRERGGGAFLAVFAISLSFLGSASGALALTDEEIFRQFPFGFVQAGARALGMGGAYVAVADDASAAEANPAGLRYLDHRQIYLGAGYINDDVRRSRSSQGSLDVNPVTGERELPFLSLGSVSSAESAAIPDLIGLSWPLSFGSSARRLTFAGSRQVVHSQELSIPSEGRRTQARFSFDSFPNTVGGGQVVAYSVSTPVTGRIASEIVYWNALAAADVHPDFSLGLTLSYATLDLEGSTRTVVEDPLQVLVDSSHPRLPAQPNTDVYTSSLNGTDKDFTYTAGVHWHPGTAFSTGLSPWLFGVSFRKGADFGLEERTLLNGRTDRRFENRISVPDQFTVGAAYRLQNRWLISSEVERVQLSDLREGFKSGVNYLTSPRLAAGAFSTGSNKSIRFKVNDGNVYRLGVEHVLSLPGSAGLRLALRAGWFRTPDMRLRMTRFNSTDHDVNRTYRDAFPGGTSESHYTAGAGLDWGASSFQVGFETSDFGQRLLATYILNWGRRP